MPLSPWTSAESARVHHAGLLAAADEHRRLRSLRAAARQEVLGRRVARPAGGLALLRRRAA